MTGPREPTSTYGEELYLRELDIRAGRGDDKALAELERLTRRYREARHRRKGFVVRAAEIERCPIKSLLPRHYREDGSCRCDEDGAE